MSITHSSLIQRVTALAACICITLSLCACGNSSENSSSTSTPSASSTGVATGVVAMFFPENGFSFSQNAPLNTWTHMKTAVNTALTSKGFSSQNISTHSDRDLDRQSQSLQNYVVEHIKDNADVNADHGGTTLIIAPAAQATDITQRYGDYAAHSLATASSDNSSQESAIARMTRALELAKKAGMHTVILSTPLPDFEPDVFISLTNARQIGRMQAQQLVSKLRLDATSRYNPKYVEIMLPINENSSSPDEEQQFASEAFKGIWEVIGPYYRSGVVLSPSMSVSASTTVSDWQDVTFNSADDDSVSDALCSRLDSSTNKHAHVRIDGIIAMNDFVASNVTSTLSDLGYTGSSADINPSITIGDIVGNITGKQDLQREQVPDPTRSPDIDDEGAKSQADEQSAMSWPIVTGYGAYISNIPNIVNGKQWMTGLVNRDLSAQQIAQLCESFAQGSSISDLDFVNNEDLYGSTLPTISPSLLAVSAGNLKTSLIDPGYITLADAGL